MPKINDYLQGFQNSLPGMKDFRHASRLYIDDLYKLLPKQKFMYYVNFDTDETLFADGQFTTNERYQLNALVKACELPKYDMSLEEKVQYNKKMYTPTRIVYSPVNITFHDDMADTTNAFWKKYYNYHIADENSVGPDANGFVTRDTAYAPVDAGPFKNFGLDTYRQRKKPYLRGVQIFVLHKQRFTSMALVNPIVGSFSHGDVDQADGQGLLANTMQIFYESVIYSAGTMTPVKGKGFAQVNYDNEPSPLTVLGGGTNSIFGPGGIVDGVGSVIRNVRGGNILGAILSASNTYNNAKKIKKKDAKEELKGIAKKGVLEVGKRGGTTGPLSQFAIGAAIAGTVKTANAKGTADNNDKSDLTVISASTQDTTRYFSADESFQLVSNDENIKDEIAAGIYYKDIGSRKDLTVAESDIEYTNSSDTTKTVYRNKAITDIRKLVTEGYIKIDRNNQDVSVSAEKVSL
jgi:hypothetical protein